MAEGDPPKLFTAKTFFIAVLAAFAGTSFPIVREFGKTGSVSGFTITCSAIGFGIALVVIILIGRHANKPEG